MAGEQRILLRRGTRSEWSTSDPTLSSGEPSYDSTNQNYKVGDGASAYTALQSVLPAGVILDFAGASAQVPDGFLECDGSAINRGTYSELFAAIGTTWGAGDGSTTFNLPDLRGAFVRGTGSHGSETMANGNPYAGPAVGAFEDDQMQGHDRYVFQSGNNTTAITSFPDRTPSTEGSIGGVNDNNYVVAGGDFTGPANTGKSNGGITDDGTNGTPRTGDETRPFAAGVTKIIKAF